MSRVGFAEIGDHFVNGVPGNEVAQRLLAGNDAHGLAFVLGNIVAEQFRLLETRGEKMDIVEHRVGNAGFG
jgi:hypothetical protein